MFLFKMASYAAESIAWRIHYMTTRMYVCSQSCLSPKRFNKGENKISQEVEGVFIIPFYIPQRHHLGEKDLNRMHNFMSKRWLNLSSRVKSDPISYYPLELSTIRGPFKC